MNLSDLPPGTPTIQFPGGCISRPTTGEVYETRDGKTQRLYTLDEARMVLVTGQTPDDRVRADWGMA